MMQFAHACVAATLASTMLTMWLWALYRLAHALWTRPREWFIEALGLL